ncbi:MAG: DUF885 domain-containing protein [Actinomycetota bacterium]|nr:DUF885 domain-containing protein [Actinomycetota bacterium]
MDAVGFALAAVEDAWEQVQHSPYIARDLGRPVDRLPEITEEAALAQSARARAVLAKIEAIDVAELPHELRLTLEVARSQMTVRARAGEWYWLLFDPLQVGFYAMYAPTAYGGGFLLGTLAGLFGGYAFAGAGDVDRYLGLVEDLGRLLRQLDGRTRGQAERGIHLPRVQLEQAVPLMSALRANALAGLVPSETRLADPDARALIGQRVATAVLPAYDDAIDWLSHPDRATAAGEDVGLANLPGGRAVYDELVRLHTTLDLTADEVHQRGLTRVAEIREQMQAILDEVGAAHAPQEHMDHLAKDPAWRAEGGEAIAAVFQRYIDRLKPLVDTAFRLQPAAGYGAVALPDALASSMTFGYYDAPSPAEPSGRYLFNAGNLSQQALANVAPLTYHELVPGHHFHIALQRENQGLHHLRRYCFVNAFNEGWAEYAAHVAGELGMYELPEERFGKLVMEAFLTTRLVVDTGMNALGWSLEQARDFMRENAFVSESEILTESVRYACDLPGQALAYKIGDLFLQDLRAGMQEALGEHFDLRDFHDAVLRPGSLPLHLVGANVARAIAAGTDRLALV